MVPLSRRPLYPAGYDGEHRRRFAPGQEAALGTETCARGVQPRVGSQGSFGAFSARCRRLMRTRRCPGSGPSGVGPPKSRSRGGCAGADGSVTTTGPKRPERLDLVTRYAPCFIAFHVESRPKTSLCEAGSARLREGLWLTCAHDAAFLCVRLGDSRFGDFTKSAGRAAPSTRPPAAGSCRLPRQVPTAMRRPSWHRRVRH